MFGAIIENWVIHDLDTTHVVNVELGFNLLKDEAELQQKIANPRIFFDIHHESMVLKFSIR